jgi:hypothetical protein
MPVNVIVGLLSLLVAVVLYTVGTWTAFRKKGFGTAQVVMLWLGVVFDVLATGSMAVRIGGLDLSSTGWLHTVLALLVMAGMAISAAVGTWAMVKKNDALGASMARIIVVPWAAWVAMFVWGLFSRMPSR